MEFAFSEKTEKLRRDVESFLRECIYDAEPIYNEQVAAGDLWATPPVVEELKIESRKRGLWNLFLPNSEFGAGLTNLEYAPLAEVSGRSPYLAPVAMNCSAPDTGNMEILAHFGTQAVKDEWLKPLLEGTIRSAYSMTEPDVASSDVANISTRIDREGTGFRISGTKWWSSGAMGDHCKVAIVMGLSDPEGERHRRHTLLVVPLDAPGVTRVRSTSVLGFNDSGHGGHGEIAYDNVWVPEENLLGEYHGGFAIAQARLGPGRIHHAMRAIGMAERAFDLMCERGHQRSPFGKPLADQGVFQEWVADSRIEIEQVRLLVLKTAWLMDTVGNRGAAGEISSIKVAAPAMVSRVIDRAIQAHGGAGVSQDFPLARLFALARILHLADGPDEVHRAALARRELRRYR